MFSIVLLIGNFELINSLSHTCGGPCAWPPFGLFAIPISDQHFVCTFSDLLPVCDDSVRLVTSDDYVGDVHMR